MISPKLKAQAIFNKMLFCYQGHIDEYTAKQCALVAVDEIIEAIDFDWMEVQNLDSEHRFWEKVRQEIEKL
jgi:hypothetical protein